MFADGFIVGRRSINRLTDCPKNSRIVTEFRPALRLIGSIFSGTGSIATLLNKLDYWIIAHGRTRYD